MKRLARWILRKEIKALNARLGTSKRLAERLALRLKPYEPAVVSDGTDQADNLKFRMDIAAALGTRIHMHTGNYTYARPIPERDYVLRDGLKVFPGELNQDVHSDC